jgi:hypothetical protein
MFVMLAAVVVGGLGGWAAGGSLAHLASFRARAWALLVGAVVVEASLALAHGPVRTVLAVAACLIVVVWCAVNGSRAGRFPYAQALIALGVVLNATVMALNSGMPVSSWALGAAGLRRTTDVARGHFYKHSAMTVHTRLRLLGDIVPFRLMRTVLSPGDLLMLVGIAAITWAATQPSRARGVRLANLASRTPG